MNDIGYAAALIARDLPDGGTDTRRMQLITLRPSLKAEIEKRRGKLSRSAWIERAIVEKIAREPFLGRHGADDPPAD